MFPNSSFFRCVCTKRWKLPAPPLSFLGLHGCGVHPGTAGHIPKVHCHERALY